MYLFYHTSARKYPKISSFYHKQVAYKFGIVYNRAIKSSLL
ncbi:hypothetical protein SMSK23_0264 [Streptococcus oralis ATCC 35037]|nr:hypothetical protein SMSK23_0264 [Streptococcus oralis ATCC 35037]